jgi:hypothetical protein
MLLARLPLLTLQPFRLQDQKHAGESSFPEVEFNTDTFVATGMSRPRSGLDEY